MRVVHFEIPADEPARASQFYSGVFGWKFQKWDGPMEYWMVDTGSQGPGINGGMMRREGAQGLCNVIAVDSIDDVLNAVQKQGGRVTVPKFEIPGVGQVAYCADTEGNPFGLMQPLCQ
jgi:predicted enzyme related to lactoylglutathione lyase